MSKKPSLIVLNETFTICKFGFSDEIPNWVYQSSWYSITKTEDELSIVCVEKVVSSGIQGERDWRCIKVLGPLDFSLVGILSEISRVLAENRISIFVVSTYDTDYILVKEEVLDKAIDVLKSDGYNWCMV